jgi:lysozyme
VTPELEVAIRAELMGDEGKVLRVYDDATGKPIVKGSIVQGNPSIGIGRNLAGRGISDSEAELMLGNDCDQGEIDLLPLLPWLKDLSTNRQAAIYCLYFNLDEGNPKRFIATWPNFLAQMQGGEFGAAADNLATSQPWATEVGPGRVGRMANLVRYG